ncbi:DUF885 family protein, partial [Streptomyces lancefieldiae]
DLPRAMDGYIQTLREGIARGITPARRQVREVLAQVRKHAEPDGFFAGLAADAELENGSLPASLARDLSDAAGAATSAYGELADFLATDLDDAATEQDAVGREIYALRSRQFLGAKIDLDETYDWGVEELARMVAEQEAVAR